MGKKNQALPLPALASTMPTSTTRASMQRGATIANGNLYGSSQGRGHHLRQAACAVGERVRRVKTGVVSPRKEIEGTFEKFGFFDEYTQGIGLDFDTDEQLLARATSTVKCCVVPMKSPRMRCRSTCCIRRAAMRYVRVVATSNATMGESSLVTYSDLMHLSIDLDNNRTPKHTTVNQGLRMVITRTLSCIPRWPTFGLGAAAHVFKAMERICMAPCFHLGKRSYGRCRHCLPMAKWAAVGSAASGVVPEMLKWAGAGGDASASATSYETGGKFDVFPILVVGNESFTTIGFQTDGNSVKFKIYHKAPGEATADRNDPYGETGFTSIKWPPLDAAIRRFSAEKDKVALEAQLLEQQMPTGWCGGCRRRMPSGMPARDLSKGALRTIALLRAQTRGRTRTAEPANAVQQARTGGPRSASLRGGVRTWPDPEHSDKFAGPVHASNLLWRIAGIKEGGLTPQELEAAQATRNWAMQQRTKIAGDTLAVCSYG
ncbi:hypothetical protein FQA39_LY18825 [Lamprigera yunnana]|nr:hypothetical protein FQA39_LY18825 [Lamprigera yunnana]